MEVHDLGTYTQQLLNGTAPFRDPDEFGEWAHLVGDWHRTYEQSGQAAMRRVIAASTNAHQGLARVLAGSNSTMASSSSNVCPALPTEATEIYKHLAPCGQWLDAYVSFAQQAAPMTPRSLHETAGLFLGSLAIGRRLVFMHGVRPTFCNLYALWIGPTTVYRKSAGFDVMREVLVRADLAHLLLPDDVTPEMLIQEMSLNVPQGIDKLSPGDRQLWLRERAFASQRGIALDEASFLLDSLRRDYKVGMLDLLLKLYNCEAQISQGRITRGRMAVRDTFLSFFGTTTFRAIEEHLRDETLWAKGFWRRFALLVPEHPPQHSTALVSDYPPELIARLRQLHETFSVPVARLERENEKTPFYVVLYGVGEPSFAEIDPIAFHAWQVYSRATSFDLLVANNVEDLLAGSYGHAATQALKIAMILAAMDTTHLPVRIQPCHFARAQQVVENWRAQLHRIWSDYTQTAESQLSDRLYELLSNARPAGLATRELCRRTHRPSKEVTDALVLLEGAARVRQQIDQRPSGHTVTLWVADEGTQS